MTLPKCDKSDCFEVASFIATSEPETHEPKTINSCVRHLGRIIWFYTDDVWSDWFVEKVNWEKSDDEYL